MYQNIRFDIFLLITYVGRRYDVLLFWEKNTTNQHCEFSQASYVKKLDYIGRRLVTGYSLLSSPD